MEGNPALLHSDIFSDTSSDSPLTEVHISILHADGPGLSPNDPMAIVQAEVLVESPLAALVEVTSIPDGRYLIKSRAADLYWNAINDPVDFVYFFDTTMESAKGSNDTQVNKHSTNILVFRK